jgi:hypothetical protein
MVVRIAGERMYLWRAVDHEGEVLDMLVQRPRDSRAALRLMRKLLKKPGFAPKLLVSDKLRSYASALRRLRLTCPQELGSGNTIAPKLASGNATTRAQNAALQIGSLRPAFPHMHAAVHNTFLQSYVISRPTLRNSGPMLLRSEKVLSQPHDTWSVLGSQCVLLSLP